MSTPLPKTPNDKPRHDSILGEPVNLFSFLTEHWRRIYERGLGVPPPTGCMFLNSPYLAGMRTSP